MISLYIHFPFCIRKCYYCDFLSFSAEDEVRDKYVTALCQEIRQYSGYVREPLYSIFFGGGTPSLLTPEQLSRIMKTVREGFDVIDGAEISMECNPGTVTEDKLRSYRYSGINRLSIGLQSANDDELRILGRIHDLKDFESTFAAARRVGFDNLNVDIISAIPGQNVGSYEKTLTKVVNYDPEHISAYSLIIEEGTKYHEIFGCDNCVNTDRPKSMNRPDPDSSDSGRREMKVDINLETEHFLAKLPPLPDEEDERRMYYLTRDLLDKAGYHRYEISNYSKSGRECRHNKVYWTGGDYIGVGLGASSYLDGYRYRNMEELKTYLDVHMYMEEADRFEEKSVGGSDLNSRDTADYIKDKRYHENTDKLTVKDKMEEYMFLGLRLTEGISKSEFCVRFGMSMRDVYSDTIDKFKDDGLLIESADRLRLSDRGIDVSNTVLSNFLLD